MQGGTAGRRRSPDEVLHALRIHGKRLRYTGELAVTAGRKPVRRLVASRVAMRQAWPAAWQLVQYRAQALTAAT